MAQAINLKVAKWGNSFAVRLPSEFVRRRHLQPGDTIDLRQLAGERLGPALSMYKPAHGSAPAQSLTQHPFFGSRATDAESVESTMTRLRRGRNRDL